MRGGLLRRFDCISEQYNFCATSFFMMFWRHLFTRHFFDFFQTRNCLFLFPFRNLRKFFKSANFEGWLRHRQREIRQKLELLHLEALGKAVSRAPNQELKLCLSLIYTVLSIPNGDCSIQSSNEIFWISQQYIETNICSCLKKPLENGFQLQLKGLNFPIVSNLSKV